MLARLPTTWLSRFQGSARHVSEGQRRAALDAERGRGEVQVLQHQLEREIGALLARVVGRVLVLLGLALRAPPALSTSLPLAKRRGRSDPHRHAFQHREAVAGADRVVDEFDDLPGADAPQWVTFGLMR